MRNIILFAGTFERARVASEELNEYFPTLGVLSLATNLELSGYHVTVIDYTVNKITIDEITSQISNDDTMLLGFCVYSENLEACIMQAKFFKKSFPNIKILFGGPHPSLEPLICIKNKYVDYVLVNEGDASIIELCEAVASNERNIRLEDIQGLYYKINGKVIQNEDREPIKNIDLNPIISRKYVGYENFKRWATIYTSRGCPGRCIYCAASALSGSTYRVRDIDNVYLETLFLLSKVSKIDPSIIIYYIDDTFTALPSRINRYIEIVNKYKAKYKWRCESRVDVMNEKIINQMASIGCIQIQYGMESGSQEVLDKIRKHMNLDKALRIIKATHDAGISVVTSFIFGHFCDTRETMTKTLKLVQFLYNTYENMNIFVSYNTPFPGTYQYEHLDELGMKLLINDYTDLTMSKPVVETANFTKEDQMEFYLQTYALMNITKR